MSRHRSWLALVLCALVLTVALGRAAAARRVALDVRWYGALKEILHQGRLEGRTRIAAALARPHAYALGALAHLGGEFVVLDGTVFLSRPDDRGGVTNTMSSAGEDSVALMVFAHVAAWSDWRVTRPIALAALQDTVAARAAALGLPPGGPFPFLIEGPVSGLNWHVADGRQLPPGPSTHEAHARASVHGERDAVAATLLGFYSDHHMGVFLHHDLEVHVHALLPSEGLAAHVDGVTVSPGAVLRLPRSR